MKFYFCYRTMITLPQHWVRIKVKDRSCLLGLNVDFVQLLYQLYVIDLTGFKIWFENKTKSQMSDTLQSKGFLDLDDEKIELFLTRLLALIQKDLQINNDDKCLRFKVSDNTIEWEFTPITDSQRTNEIYSKFILNQMSTINVLNAKMKSIVDTIHERDNYMKYLKENYRLINGEALLKKYQKINPNPEVSEEFNVNAWEKKLDSINNLHSEEEIIENFLKRIQSTKEHISPKRRRRSLEHINLDNIPVIKSEESAKPSISPKRQKRGVFKPKKKS